MGKYCRQCNKSLSDSWSTDICLECSEENVRKIFKEHPEVKQAFKESIEEMKKPENIKKMAESTTKVFSVLQNLRGGK